MKYPNIPSILNKWDDIQNRLLEVLTDEGLISNKEIKETLNNFESLPKSKL